MTNDFVINSQSHIRNICSHPITPKSKHSTCSGWSDDSIPYGLGFVLIANDTNIIIAGSLAGNADSIALELCRQRSIRLNHIYSDSLTLTILLHAADSTRSSEIGQLVLQNTFLEA